MIIYTLFFLILAFFSFESVLSKGNSKLYFLGAIIIVLFVSLRGNGFDWDSYHEIYTTFHKGGERRGAEFIEYGFQWFCVLAPSYRILIFLIGVVSVSLTLKGTYYFSKDNLPMLGLLIFATMYLTGTYMGQIRQATAMGCVCMAIWQNYKGEKINAILWIGIGMLFHMTAVLGLLILVTPKKKLHYWQYIGLLVLSIVGYRVCLNIAAHFIGTSDSAAAEKALVYAQVENESLSLSTVILRIITLSLVLYLNKGSVSKISYISNIYCWSIIIYLVFGFLPQLASRGAYYFALYDMIMLPYIVVSLKKKPALYITSFVIVVGLSLYRVYSSFQDSFFIYSFIPYIK